MRALVLVCLVPVVVACTSVSSDPDNGSGELDAGAVTTTPGPGTEVCEDVIDLVFVLDTSSSMGFVLSKLEQQIASVVAASNQLAADSHFGLVVFQDNFLVDSSGELDGGVVHTGTDSLQAAFSHYRQQFTEFDRNPGDGVGGPTTQNPLCEENSLDALYAAAKDFPWRENATKVVIVVTDDTFLESPDNYGDRDGDGDTTSSDYPSEGHYPALRSLAETSAALIDAKIRVFSFTRLTEPGFFDLGRCGTPRRRPWSDIRAGWSAAYDGAKPIPAQTDGRNFDVDMVRDGSLSLVETINEVVVESYCSPPVE